MTGLIGTDGLRARDNGIWGTEKLDFLQFFAPVALTATATKRQHHYVDLFAGPGLNRVGETTQEYDGSPLRAIEIVSDRPPEISFTHGWFVNRDRRDHSALRQRIDRRRRSGRCRIIEKNVRCVLGDANLQVKSILEAIHPLSYALVFADMEAPKQCRWSTISALRTYKKHKSIDLYMLFPLDMAIRRLISRNSKTIEQAGPTLSAFYGDDRWKELLRYREVESSANTRELGQHALQLYVQRLQEHWAHVDVIYDVRRGSRQKLYKMLFASNDDAGKKIASWAKKRSSSQGQLELL